MAIPAADASMTHEMGAKMRSRFRRLATSADIPRERHSRQSANCSRSSSSAPGSRSKKASRLRSSPRRSCGIVPSSVCIVTCADEPSVNCEMCRVDAPDAAFRNQTQTVDQGVTSHVGILVYGRLKV